MGHLRVTVGHLRATIGHLTASKGNLRATINYRSPGHLRVTML